VRTIGCSHALVITSIKDLTSTVVFEALAQGVPVVCPDHCGFADVVTEDCGVKLPVKTPAQLTFDLGLAIRGLAADEQKRRRLARGALKRISEFTWERKAQQVDLIYRNLVAA
jgi:glycosyltransferase involved in cell wall biosynthesis